jgi:tetratricopeptide (TPR) repeat protein
MTEQATPFPPLPVALRLAYQQAIELLESGQGAFAEAVYRRILDRLPHHAEARYLLAMVRLQQHDRVEAMALFDQVITQLQDFAQPALAGPLLARALVGKGNALAVEQRYDEAIKIFEQAEQADPTNPEGAFNQGRLWARARHYERGRQAFQRALDACPQHRQSIDALGGLLTKQGDYQKAITHYQTALAQGIPLLSVVANLASAYEMAGQLDQAAEVLDQAVALGGSEALSATAHLVRSGLARRQKAFDQALAAAELALQRANDRAQRCAAFFALGLCHDQMGAFDAAFAAFEQGNRLAREACDEDQMGRRIFRDHVLLSQQMASPQALAALPPPSAEAEQGAELVFFVGFPRSGTTLMEQILGAHPRLLTTMEVSPLDAVLRALGADYPLCLPRLDEAARAALRAVFWSQAEAAVGALEGRFLIDKMPLNLAHLALIQRLFPAAKLLVALRDPRDVVLSCYMQNFAPNLATIAFQDLTSSAETYHEVMGLWMAQREHLALSSLAYRYEDLIAAPTETVTAVLDFLTVGWDPAVERYREKAETRNITTPSYRDVTAPLFRRAIGRWQAYRAHLDPVLPLLDPYVEAFGYRAETD